MKHLFSESITSSSKYVAVVTKAAADNVLTESKMASGERGTTRYEGYETEACRQIRNHSLSLLVHRLANWI